MLRELRDGDVLGDHTFTHPDLTTVANVREQLQRTIGVIRSLTGYTPCVFRPPYGDYDADVVQTAPLARPGDGAVERRSHRLGPAPTQTIVSRVLEQVQPGSSASPTTAAGRGGTRSPPTRGSSRPCAAGVCGS